MRKEYLTWLTLDKRVKRNEQKLDYLYPHRSYLNPLHLRLRKYTSNYAHLCGRLYSRKSFKHQKPMAQYTY